MKHLIKTNIKLLLLATFALTINMSCTDLEEEVYSDLTGEKVFENEDNLIYGFGLAYTSLYQLTGHKYMIGSDCGTDLLVVPQRGGDWEDGGEWHRYHWQTWTPNEGYISKAWKSNYNGINTCNRLIYTFEELEGVNVTPAISELRALRAFYYLKLIDIFGNVPIVKTFPLPENYLPVNDPRDSVYKFIEEELIDVLPNLSKETGLKMYGRVNYYVAEMLLAKLYLNAQVYTGTPEWEKAEAAVDTIMESGKYALTANSSENFIADASNSTEVLFGVPFDMTEAPGFEVHLFTLHYNLTANYGIASGSWNGLSAQESLFNLFESTDERLSGLLYGPQFDKAGAPITDASYEKFDPKNPTKPIDKDGANLNLTPEINMLMPNCLRQAGARIAKFPFIEGSTTSTSNDFPIYRYSDVLLMKSELRLRNGDAAGALPYLNEVRTRSNASPASEVTEQILIDERARELFAEGHRRSDMIRFGVYTQARWEKPEVSPEYVTLWPIPQSEISVNANLKQNPGY